MFSTIKNDEQIIETIRDYIDRKLERYDSPRYTYMVIDKKNPVDVFIVTSYPDEWADIYTSQNYQHIDPIVLTAFKRISPFAWDENITILSDLKSSKIFALSKKYNIVNGFTFVLHDHMNNLAMLSLIMDNNADKGLNSRIESDKDRLQMNLIKIHEKMLMLEQNKLGVSNGKNTDTSGKGILSPRENEVLHWASMGKTYPEIALIAGITTRTVKHHMGNVVKKLGVINARQAIRLGVELELIKPVLV
ncbi:LuxR family transcriptional regulator [Yersinia ruckeri]|nr:LuxR family transcriptional regulator [Yersinia ruckeri]AAG17669.1 response regulator YruR [Yersinia ruckeri]AJI94357.1 bacterial regulatory s, luxR family protein [Yersinia ruckeri]AKA37004.1 LuxR family transcriptional regulator [Yersinia ruckeri]ARZ01295.1 quorum-sensing transcriptional regulator [Yersinia ruckeri]AUQ43344.1 LuxR family transcriptional regulator [Yersinia ruckeri]